MPSQALWTARELTIYVHMNGQWQEHALSQPYAILGSHPRCHIQLPEPAPQRAQLVIATDHGIYTAPLRTDGLAEGWLRSGAEVELYGTSIKPVMSGGFASQLWPAQQQRRAEFLHHGTSKGFKETTLSLVTIGRRKPSHWRMAHERLSQCHCALYFENDRAWVIDLLSRNGTEVDGESVAFADITSIGSVKIDEHIQFDICPQQFGQGPAIGARTVDAALANDETARNFQQAWSLLADRDQAVKDQQDQVQELNSQVRELTQELAQSEAALRLSEREAERLQQQAELLEAQLEEAQADLADAQQRTQDQNAWTSVREDLQQRCDHWQTLAESQKQAITQLEARLLDADQLASDLRADIAQRSSAMEELQQLRQDAEEGAQAKQELDAANERAAALETELADLVAAREDSKLLQQRLEEQDAAVKVADERLDESRAKVAELEQQLEQWQATHGELNEQLERTQQELIAATDRLTESTEQSTTLSDERDRIAAERDELMAERDGLSAEREAWTGERERLMAECEARTAEREASQAERLELVEERDGLAAERDKARGEHAEAVQQLETLRSDAQVRQALVESLQSQLALAERSTTELVQTNEEGRESLRLELEAARAEWKAASDRIAELEAERDDAVAKLQSIEFGEQHEVNHNRVAELETALAAAQDSTAAAIQQREALESELERLQAETVLLSQAQSAAETTAVHGPVPPPLPSGVVHDSDSDSTALSGAHEFESAQMLADVLSTENEELRASIAGMRAKLGELQQQVAGAADLHREDLRQRDLQLQEAQQHLELLRANWEFTIERKDAELSELRRLLDASKSLAEGPSTDTIPQLQIDVAEVEALTLEGAASEDLLSEGLSSDSPDEAVSSPHGLLEVDDNIADEGGSDEEESSLVTLPADSKGDAESSSNWAETLRPDEIDLPESDSTIEFSSLPADVPSSVQQPDTEDFEAALASVSSKPLTAEDIASLEPSEPAPEFVDVAPKRQRNWWGLVLGAGAAALAGAGYWVVAWMRK